VEKKKNSYQFLNIINEKKFNKYNHKEKERFLIDNKIYIPREQDLKSPYWLYGFKYSNNYEITDWFIELTDINIMFIKEMLRYCEEHGRFQSNYSEYVKRIKRNINLTLDDLDKERVIREEYEKYYGILNSSYLTDDYFDKNIEVDDLFGCITMHGIDETTVFKYITSKYPYLEDDTPISDCVKINKSIKILKFLKIEMGKMKGSYIEKIDKSKALTNFNDHIFRTKESREWFHDTLIEMGAVDKENRAQKRIFQTRCQAIFSISECKNKIFKNRLKLKDYIEYLNATYSAKITNNSKLSDGYEYKADVKEYLKLFKDK